MALKLYYNEAYGDYVVTGSIDELTQIYESLSTEEARNELGVTPYGSDHHFVHEGGEHAITFEPNGWTSLDHLNFSNIWCIDGDDAQYYDVIKKYGDDFCCINDMIDDIKSHHEAEVLDLWD